MSLGRGRSPVRALHPRKRSRTVQTKRALRSRMVRVNPLGRHAAHAVRGTRTTKQHATARAHRTVSAATRAKLSAARKGKRHPHKGHKLSAATRSRLSAALRGRHRPHKGHATSAATRAKISKALTGKKHPHKGVHGHKLAHRSTRQRTSLRSRTVTVRRATTRRRTTARHTASLRRRH